MEADWILTGPQTWVHLSVARAFEAHRLPMPRISLAAPSALLRVHLLATGPFVTAVPKSVLRLNAGGHALKELHSDLRIAGYPLGDPNVEEPLAQPAGRALHVECVRNTVS